MTVTESRPEVDVEALVDLAERPKRRPLVRRIFMFPRRFLVRVHRWLSFALLAWLVVISVTGGWLVFSDVYESWIHPDRYATTPGDVGAQAAIDAVAPELPEAGYVYYVSLPRNSRGVYAVSSAWPADPEHPDAVDAEGYPLETYTTWYVDPGTGEINDRKDESEGFTNWMYRGHMTLWQENGFFGVFADGGWCNPSSSAVEPGGARGVVCDVIPLGDDLVAWFAVAWIVVLLSGFYLWYWPGVKRWSNAVRIQRGRGRFTFHLSLHKAIGFVVWVPLLVVAFTGMAFTFVNVGSWYENVTPAQRDFYLWTAPEDALSTVPEDGSEPLDADEFVAAAEERFPDRAFQSIANVPAGDETGTWQAWMTRGFDPWTREEGAGNVLVVMDQYTGEVLYDGTPEEGNVFDQAWDDWSYPLHTGDFGGTATRFVWTGLAMTPLLLGGTGTVMWLARRKKRKRAAARRAGTEVGVTAQG